LTTYISKNIKIHTAYLERKHINLLTFGAFTNSLSQKYRSRSAHEHRRTESHRRPQHKQHHHQQDSITGSWAGQVKQDRKQQIPSTFQWWPGI